MNDQIKELAAEAENYAYRVAVGGDECREAYTRKLAELIIHECATAMSKIPGGYSAELYYSSHKTIKQHFGVKYSREPVASPDKGPWKAHQSKNGKVYLMSDDFEHDVALIVTGDFSNNKMDYATRLSNWMNYHLENVTPQPAKEVELTDNEIDDIPCEYELDDCGLRDFARAAIAVHKEKQK